LGAGTLEGDLERLLVLVPHRHDGDLRSCEVWYSGIQKTWIRLRGEMGMMLFKSIGSHRTLTRPPLGPVTLGPTESVGNCGVAPTRVLFPKTKMKHWIS